MGLLDWLTNDVGSSMGGGGMPPMESPNQPFVDATNNYGGPGGVAQAGADTPPIAPPMPPGSDPMTAGGLSPNGPGLPPPPPAPMPMARPPGADAGPAALPPAAAPTGGTGMPPGPPPPLPPPGNGMNGVGPGLGVGAPPPGFSTPGGGATGFIGRALGLDANEENRIQGALGAGLKAAGENSHKPGLAAFAGSMGSGIEGGKKATDKTTDQQSKYLNDAIKAQLAGDTGALNVARTRLALAQAKAAEQGKDTKNSVLNSPEQLYFKAVGAANGDLELKRLADVHHQAIANGGDPNSKEAKAALNAFTDRRQQLIKEHFKVAGVDPNKADALAKQPGFTRDNPLKDFPKDQAAAKKKFEELPDGAYFINPKNGGINPKDGTPWLLIKQPPDGANTQPQAQSPTPAAPVPVTAPAGSLADQENDD